MSVFPSAPEVILAIFTTLLSLAVSLFLLKIQIINSKSVKSLENEQKVLIAKQADTNEFIRGKLVTSQETLDALDFLNKDAPVQINEIEEKIKMLEHKKKRISEKTVLGVILMLFSVGVNFYLSFYIYENDGKVFLSRLTIVFVVNFLFFAFMWHLRKILLSYDKDAAAVRQKHDFLSREILRAIDLVRKI